MVKVNRGRSRPQGRNNFRGKPKSRGRSFSKGRGRKFSKKNLSEDQLDREIEMYWGDEIGSKHLDKDMDDYWKEKKDENKE